MERAPADTILYICPYCVKGRFTAEDGWDGAVRHIRENHKSGAKPRKRRGRNPKKTFDDELLEGFPLSYDGVEQAATA